MFCFAFDCLNIALELIAVAYSQVLYYNSESLYDTWNRRYCSNQGEKASNEISQLIHIDEKIIFFFGMQSQALRPRFIHVLSTRMRILSTRLLVQLENIVLSLISVLGVEGCVVHALV